MANKYKKTLHHLSLEKIKSKQQETEHLYARLVRLAYIRKNKKQKALVGM